MGRPGMKRITKDIRKKIASLRLIAFDFDGVFTDNRVFVSEDGKESVVCHRSNGIGLTLVRDIGVKTCVVSSEPNPVVVERSKKLKIECVNNCKDKVSALKKMAKKHSASLSQVAFMGNDINDLACLECVALPIVVQDAYRDVVTTALYQTRRPGGHGAVREICDLFEGVLTNKLKNENPNLLKIED